MLLAHRPSWAENRSLRRRMTRAGSVGGAVPGIMDHFRDYICGQRSHGHGLV